VRLEWDSKDEIGALVRVFNNMSLRLADLDLAKKNFVSTQVRDYTAILKLIETRFTLSALTKRDAAQVGMDDPATGFFDFINGPWKIPPSNLPTQTVLPQSACFVNPPPTSP